MNKFIMFEYTTYGKWITTIKEWNAEQLHRIFTGSDEIIKSYTHTCSLITSMWETASLLFLNVTDMSQDEIIYFVDLIQAYYSPEENVSM